MMLLDTLHIAGAGLDAQNMRLRVVAENIANADSVGRSPGEPPYRRQMVVFKNVLNEQLGIDTVKVTDKIADQSDFEMKYAPGHPYANAEGYIQTANVNTVIEMMDMREARRAYEANLGIIEVSKSMLQRTVDLLRV